ncbi:MAG: hypothetical protein IT209_00320 [Armatimonadetes bacterium]|nr:hypothetical protein [Armatimonadota bacterium]
MTQRSAGGSAIRVLDEHHASLLGCSAEDLRSGELRVVKSPHRNIRIAKGCPLPAFAMDTGEGTLYSVRPDLCEAVSDAVRSSQNLNEVTCQRVETALAGWVSEVEWFRGVRLWLDTQHFIDCQKNGVVDISESHATGKNLRRIWGGPVFAHLIDGAPVSWAAVKLIGQKVWDVGCVETLPGFRGQSYARSVVSVALKYIFDAGRLACWGTDADNAASLRTARALGFQRYALEHGCFVL